MTFSGQPFTELELSQAIQQLNPATAASGILLSNLNFAKDALNIFIEKFNMLDTAVTETAYRFGGIREFSFELKQNAALAEASVKSLGGNMKDVLSIQEGVMKGFQTQIILDKEQYAQIFAINSLVADGTVTQEESTRKLVSSFADAGYSLYNISKEMTNVINTAREFGVATQAVYSQISANMAKLNTFNFEGGVQGMAKMAAEAALLRIDMGKTLKIADDLFKPEKAIEMASEFQRLGIQVTNLLDPYKLMDMARNDPAELQKSIIEATRQLTYFDEKNQKMAILPGAQGQLRELAGVLGMSSEELAKMAVTSADVERKMSQIRFSDAFATEEQKKMVASMAQLGETGTKFEGKYVVSFKDEQGNAVLKAVDELNETDKKRIEQIQAEKKMSPAEIQLEANGILRNIQNAIEARKGVIPTVAAAAGELDEMKKQLRDAYMPLIEAMGKPLGIQESKGGYIDVTGVKTTVEEFATSVSSNFKDVINGSKTMAQASADALKEMGTTIGKIVDNYKDILNIAQQIADEGVRQGKFDISFDYDKIRVAFQKAINTAVSGLGNIGVPISPIVINPVTPAPTGGVGPPNISFTPNINTTMASTPPVTSVNSNVVISGSINHSFPANMNQTLIDSTINNNDWFKALSDKLKKDLEDQLNLTGLPQ